MPWWGLVFLGSACAAPSPDPADPARSKRGLVGEMVDVLGGVFSMGCHDADPECWEDETAQERALEDFRIDRAEVTVALYAHCVDAGVCSTEGLDQPFFDGGPRAELAEACNWQKRGRREHPINCISWIQASAYCAWAGKRLPSESEWEKAARGTDARKYPWGARGFTGEVRWANIADRSSRQHQPEWTIAEDYDDGFYLTAPVGSFPDGASPYGAVDMIGNVYEWTSDAYGDGVEKVIRGGSFDDPPRRARASMRMKRPPEDRVPNGGLRCARWGGCNCKD